MTDHEIDYLLWRAFYLGSRVCAAHMGKDVPCSEIANLARTVREIAESDTTLHDPAALAARFPDNAHFVQYLASLNIRNNRDLAQRIVQGFTSATDVKE